MWFIHVVYSEAHNNRDAIVKHDISFIHLETPSSSVDDVPDSLAWCQTVITIAILLSVIVIVLLVLSLLCWKWNKMKDGCVMICGDCYRDESDMLPLSKIRRSHRYRPEIQELPHPSLPPSAIHVNTEQCTNTNIPTATQATTGGSASTNKRLTGSKKYIVETTM